MILLLDIGNSRIKTATLRGPEVCPGNTVVHADEGAVERLLAGIVHRPSAVYRVCVAGDVVASRVDNWCRTHWGLTPVVLRSQLECAGVTNAYTDPQTLGVDRWAAIIGAYQVVRGAVLAVDCGTVCTADLVDAQGQHRGGALTPGLRMQRESLVQGTAGIRVMDVGRESGVRFGTSTAECIESGTREAVIGFIHQMARYAEELLGGAVTLMLTGGDAPSLLSGLGRDVRYEKALVFIGMSAMIAETGG